MNKPDFDKYDLPERKRNIEWEQTAPGIWQSEEDDLIVEGNVTIQAKGTLRITDNRTDYRRKAKKRFGEELHRLAQKYDLWNLPSMN